MEQITGEFFKTSFTAFASPCLTGCVCLQQSYHVCGLCIALLPSFIVLPLCLGAVAADWRTDFLPLPQTNCQRYDSGKAICGSNAGEPQQRIEPIPCENEQRTLPQHRDGVAAAALPQACKKFVLM